VPGLFERIATALGLAGLSCILIGAAMKTPSVTYFGYALAAPLIVGGLLAAIIGLPLAFLERMQAKRREKREGR
jgi:uncharacterized integral membrane protein